MYDGGKKLEYHADVEMWKFDFFKAFDCIKNKSKCPFATTHIHMYTKYSESPSNKRTLMDQTSACTEFGNYVLLY